MAAAFFNALADPQRARGSSAGTQPGPRVYPLVAEAMTELGVDVGANRPQLLTEDLACRAALLITMGCEEECPHLPGVEREDWPLRDPKDLPLAEVRLIRDEIRARVAALVASRGWSSAETLR